MHACLYLLEQISCYPTAITIAMGTHLTIKIDLCLCIGGSKNFEKGRSRKGEGHHPEIAKNSHILGRKFLVLLAFDGNSTAKRGGVGPLLNPLLLCSF
jgi:hypothetical protein